MCFSARVVLLIFGAAFATLSLVAEVTTGALTGSVRHEGAPLPGVTITIASPAMQGTRVAYSYVNGDYNFPSIPPGDYTVSFAMEGMLSQTKKVTVGLARTERVDAVLKLAPVAESVTVTAAAPTVLETTDVQSNYTAKFVDDLPIMRTVQAVALLAPGVTYTGAGAGLNFPDALIVSGAPFYDNLYLVNGTVTNESTNGQTEDLFIEDAIQETTVIVGAISAEYGRFTGGVISTITKSGGNELSGSMRDSLTNPSWTSASAYGEGRAGSNLGETYEGTFGGRFVRDRLWFFTAGRYAETSTQGYYTSTDIAMPVTEVTDERFELKLTGQPSPRHSLMASYLDYDVSSTNVCLAGSCYEDSTVDLSQSISRVAAALRYSGTVTSNLFAEASWSSRERREQGVGGDHRTADFGDPRDIALGTVGFDGAGWGGIWGASTGCGVCPDKSQENEYLTLKGNWYVPTERMGTHYLAFGYESFLESVDADLHVSGSDFNVLVWSASPEREGDGTLRPIVNPGDWIGWLPVQVASQGSRLVTDSLFVNDKWDLGSKWSFNLGIRYDRNDGKDRAGNQLSNDENVSPRLGVIYDVRGDGRFRVNASYSKYVSKIWENMGFMTGSGGQPWFVYYDYRGPTVGGRGSGLDSFGVLEEVFRWFLANGGTGASDLVLYTVLPGVNTRVPELDSPNVVEWTIGFGMQLGSGGFARIDAIDREWHDSYSASTTIGDVVENPLLPGTYLDVLTYGNSEVFERTYEGVSLQGGYRMTPRLSAGGNYTWSRTRGNYLGGQYPDVISPLVYPEYNDYPEQNPVGYLETDQTHKGRLWISYEQPLGTYGKVNLSLLESYESGRPYSAWTWIDPSPYVENPGYAMPLVVAAYHFSGQGEYRWEAATATDLAINYELPVRGARLFLQTDILNLFDEQAQVNGNKGVASLAPFDPFTETPKECPQGQADCTGYNWKKGANFGKATMPNHYQQPRTYRFSVGVRF